MDKHDIKTKILDAFARVGFLVDDENIPLNEYIPDSLGFVTLVLELEDTFGITFPNELLTMESFNTIENLVAIISDAINVS